MWPGSPCADVVRPFFKTEGFHLRSSARFHKPGPVLSNALSGGPHHRVSWPGPGHAPVLACLDLRRGLRAGH